MKRNKIFIISIMLLFSLTNLFSQVNQTVNGKLVDEQGNAIAEAIVSGDEGDVFTTTDTEGAFQLEILISDVLLFEKEGYIKKQMNVTEILATSGIVSLVKYDFLMSDKDMLVLPFQQLSYYRTTGAVGQVNVPDARSADARKDIWAVTDGMITGMAEASNIWGRGNALVVVDGVPRWFFDYDMRNVETVTVLKDPVTRSRYGVRSDQGVIMVTTKRGKAFKKELNFQGEYGIYQAKKYALPEYMNSADYMETYNTIFPNTYSAQKITDTRDGVNPHFNPDVDLLSDQFLKSYTDNIDVFAEASGGNGNAQYYMNFGWEHNNGWMKLGDQDIRDRLNIRGNVDFKLTDNIKMKLDAVAVLDNTKSPLASGPSLLLNKKYVSPYWNATTTLVPNAYPLTWDPAIITNETERRALMKTDDYKADGNVLGGSKIYPNNIYGDFTRSGNMIQFDRNIQVNFGATWDLKKLLPGLKLAGNVSFDTYNMVNKSQSSTYAVYNPLLLQREVTPGSGVFVDSISYETVGVDKRVSNYSIKTETMGFYRQFGMFANLNYDKSFGKMDVSLVAATYGDKTSYTNAAQRLVNQNFTVGGNVMFDKKYLLDLSMGWVGTQKMPQEDQYAFTPSVGLGWIVSKESFFDNVTVIDFLKLRASAGILKNDTWSQYDLYQQSYRTGGNFTYNNGGSTNQSMDLDQRNSMIDWQKRKEFVVGFDASMLNNSLWVEGSFFSSERYDMLTELTTLPSLMGTKNVSYWGNYEADRLNGVEFGIKYNTQITNDISLLVGSNLLTTFDKVTKKLESDYANAYQYREGTETNAIWGLASDGLYGAGDFDPITGELNTTLAQPTFGQVAPGDIKYIDKDGNGVIDSDDEHVIAQDDDAFQYSLYVTLKVKQFELYALGRGYVGDMNTRQGDYYRVYGNLKFPEHIKDAYSATNPDVNADYPRLTASKSNHNDRTSEFWLYKNNSFTIPAIQLTYNLNKGSNSVVNLAKFYVRGTDLVSFNKNKKYTNVSLGKAPNTYGIVAGTILSF